MESLLQPPFQLENRIPRHQDTEPAPTQMTAATGMATATVRSPSRSSKASVATRKLEPTPPPRPATHSAAQHLVPPTSAISTTAALSPSVPRGLSQEPATGNA